MNPLIRMIKIDHELRHLEPRNFERILSRIIAKQKTKKKILHAYKMNKINTNKHQDLEHNKLCLFSYYLQLQLQKKNNLNYLF